MMMSEVYNGEFWRVILRLSYALRRVIQDVMLG